MAKNIHSNYYADNLEKVECQNCKRSFIVGEKLSEGMNLSCAYCQSINIEKVSYATDEILEDMDLGCLNLGFHMFKNGDLMLYTSKELFEVVQELTNNNIDVPCGELDQVIQNYCTKRDKEK